MKLSVFIACLFSCSSIFSLYEQREIIFERLEPLPEPNLFAFDSLRVKKFNRTTYVVDGIVTVKKDLDDTMDFTATINSMTGNQYKKIVDKKLVGWCKSMWDPKAESYYNYVRNHSNFPEYG